MSALVLLVALASGAPPRPHPSTPGPLDCAAAQALDTAVLGCAAVAVPPADLADLLADRAWAAQLDGHLALCEAGRPRVRPGVAFGGGVVVGVAVIVAGAWVARASSHDGAPRPNTRTSQPR